MTFKEIDLKHTYDSSSSNLVEDFFIPVLKKSVLYQRGVGYFTSGWLKKASEGIISIVNNSGKIQFITSPILNKDDLEALAIGCKAMSEDSVYKALEVNISEIEKELDINTKNALAWLIADGILEFRLALPRNKLDGGDFHSKFGVFTDSQNNKIAFSGSYNDTVHANINFEEITVFSSLNDTFAEIIKAKEVLFNRIWENTDPNIQVYKVPNAIKDKLIKFQNSERPYKKPEKNKFLKQTISPREYQKKAMDSWANNNYKGILEMATGTGKTKTALFALRKLIDSYKVLVIISCPSKSLVDQWFKECVEFNHLPIIAYSDNYKWKDQLANKVSNLNMGIISYQIVINTHNNLKSDSLKKIIKKLNTKIKTLLIGDECHHLGTFDIAKKAFKVASFSLGLSATPSRFFDQDGSETIEKLFGEIIFSFPLKEAIGKFLCEYEYYIHVVNLTEDEKEEYIELSNKINRFFGRSCNLENEIKSNSRLQILLLKRSNILKKAQNKVLKLQELLNRKKEEFNLALIFCHPDVRELNIVAKMLSDSGIISRRFTGEESLEQRNQTIDDFINKKIQVITSMNIFNEGIDVPETKEAFILSSSSNPMEYIQRRGRVLRKPKSYNKEKAIIHDFLVIPPVSDDPEIKKHDKRIIKKEIERFQYFAEDALNKYREKIKLQNILEDLGYKKYYN
jgi:superfamily II DNA or RNA helicase